MLLALILGTVLVSVMTGSWVPVLVLGGLGTATVWGTVMSSGNTLDVRLV